MSKQLLQMGQRARDAMASLQAASGAARSALLEMIADRISENATSIISANNEDMREARGKGLSSAMLDRLMLDDARVAGIATAIRAIAHLPDPVGTVLKEWTQPNGLRFAKVSVPLGVIAIIYESRPNVTADAAAICLKAANSVILRGGSESVHSSRAIVALVRESLEAQGFSADSVQMVPSQDRHLVGSLLSGLDGHLDVVVPRGGKALVERVKREARIPVIGHLEGLCHIFVHRDADKVKASEIVINAKLRRTGICGAVETLLIDKTYDEHGVSDLFDSLREAGCELRVCANLRKRFPLLGLATEEDWTTEYLAPVLSVRLVDDIAQAMAHIAHYGSGHTDAIVTENQTAADQFLSTVDSAIVMHNASTQFADGGEFGMGAEIGISTSRIHARGPVGAEQLTSYKYVVRGSGQTRGD